MTVASPEDRQYKLEKGVRGTDFDIQTFETRSTRATAHIRYPCDEKASKGRQERKGKCVHVYNGAGIFNSSQSVQGTKNRKMAEFVGI